MKEEESRESRSGGSEEQGERGKIRKQQDQELIIDRGTFTHLTCLEKLWEKKSALKILTLDCECSQKPDVLHNSRAHDSFQRV